MIILPVYLPFDPKILMYILGDFLDVLLFALDTGRFISNVTFIDAFHLGFQSFV